MHYGMDYICTIYTKNHILHKLIIQIQILVFDEFHSLTAPPIGHIPSYTRWFYVQTYLKISSVLSTIKMNYVHTIKFMACMAYCVPISKYPLQHVKYHLLMIQPVHIKNGFQYFWVNRCSFPRLTHDSWSTLLGTAYWTRILK